MLKTKVYCLLILLLSIQCAVNTEQKRVSKPKLVVGIVIDQMRADYLERFNLHFEEGGFRRLMNEGLQCKNTQYNYVPTATAPGHASIYTGTTPSHHGIIGNQWYDRRLKREITSVEDQKEGILGVNQMEVDRSRSSASPRKLLSHTITDELKLHSPSSKVIGISLKDRGAILPAGHLADYALWYDKLYGQMVTSTYYGKEAPDWLSNFNERKLPDSLLSLTWAPIKPIQSYNNSEPDDSPYEKIYKGRVAPTFPYDLGALRKENGNYELLWETPFGNTLVSETAKEAIRAEQLGIDEQLDFLTISYSGTDLVGHAFGSRSKELEDTYARLDMELADLLSFLDQEVGEGNYLVFLTADHGAANHPGFLQGKELPGQLFRLDEIKRATNAAWGSNLDQKPFLHFAYNQVYLTEPAKDLFNSDSGKNKLMISGMQRLDGVRYAMDLSTSLSYMNDYGELGAIARGYYPDRSGDFYLAYAPGWLEQRDFGASHGSFYHYDTHVPLVWYGANVKKGETLRQVSITDIAPTLAHLLGIPVPNAATGQPIQEVLYH